MRGKPRDPNKEYVLYKGEKELMTGTLSEIAKARGVKEQSVLYLKYPSSIARDKRGNRMVLVDLED